MLNAPCMNCTERKFKCHSTCEKYKAFRAEREKKNKGKYLDQSLRSYEINRNYRIYNKYRSKKK